MILSLIPRKPFLRFGSLGANLYFLNILLFFALTTIFDIIFTNFSTSPIKPLMRSSGTKSVATSKRSQ